MECREARRNPPFLCSWATFAETITASGDNFLSWQQSIQCSYIVYACRSVCVCVCVFLRKEICGWLPGNWVIARWLVGRRQRTFWSFFKVQCIWRKYGSLYIFNTKSCNRCKHQAKSEKRVEAKRSATQHGFFVKASSTWASLRTLLVASKNFVHSHIFADDCASPARIYKVCVALKRFAAGGNIA